MLWFCILTNLVSILPIRYFFSKKMYNETILTLGTGVSSLLYHGNNSDPTAWNWFDEKAIRNTDVVLSIVLLFYVANMAISHAINKKILASVLTTAMLPIAIYTTESSPFNKEYLLIVYGGVSMILAVIKRKRFKQRYLFMGILSTFCDLALVIPEHFDYRVHYYLLHGIHHIMAFSSVYLFSRSVYE